MINLIKIGHIVRAHGIKGEVGIKWDSDECPLKIPLDTVFLNKEGSKKCLIKNIRSSAKGDLVKLSDVDDRTKAEGLRGCGIWTQYENLIPLGDGEYYTFQLMNFDVESIDGKYIGKLKSISSLPAHDLYVVEDKSNEEILIPAVDKIVKEIDLDNKKIIVHLIEGLEDLNK